MASRQHVWEEQQVGESGALGWGQGLASEEVAEYRDGQHVPCGQPAWVQTQLCHILISPCLSFLPVPQFPPV